jgi:hypothetical protein
MKSRLTRFPNFNPSTAGGLMTWILLISVCLPLVRLLVQLGWSGADIVFGVAIAIAAMIGLAAIVTPIAMKRTLEVAANRHYAPFYLDSTVAPEVFRRWAETLTPALHGLGFAFLGHFRPSDADRHSDAFVSLFENRTSSQTALFFTVTAKRAIFRLSETVLVYTTEFADDTRLLTSNNQTLSPLPRIRIRKGSMSFPYIDDPNRLYAIHQAALALFARDAVRVENVIEDPAEFLARAHQKDVARFAECGFYYLDPARNVYRLTWRGAILMSWKALWPFKRIRELLRRAQAARLLRDLDLST